MVINFKIMDQDGFTTLHRAAESGNSQWVGQLLHLSKADLEAKDKIWRNTPLWRAVLAKDCTITAMLLEAKAQVDSPNINGVTPLYQACTAESSCELIELLLRAKAQMDHETFKQTPLHGACLSGRTGAVEILLKHKANINALTRSGVSGLYLASERGHVDIAKLLVQGKANVNAVGPDGITPLMRAAYKNQYKVAQALVELKASVEMMAMGKDAAMWAKQQGNVAIFDMLMAISNNKETANRQHKQKEKREASNPPELSEFLTQIQLKDILNKFQGESIDMDVLLKAKESELDKLFLKLQLNLGQKLKIKTGLKNFNNQFAKTIGFIEVDVTKRTAQEVSHDIILIHPAKLGSCCRLGLALADSSQPQSAEPPSPTTDMQAAVQFAKVNALREYCATFDQMISQTMVEDRFVEYVPGEPHRIPIVDIRGLNITSQSVSVGGGSQADVFLVACWSPPNSNFTVKHEFVAKLPHKGNVEALHSLQQEAEVWMNIPPHPNIAHLSAIVQSDSSSPTAHKHKKDTCTVEGMLLPYYPLGSLDRLKLFRLHEDDLIHGLMGLAQALVHLHSVGVVHRDIAPRNVLVSMRKEFILTDFGMSRFGETSLDSTERLPWRSLAPEILRERRLMGERQRLGSDEDDDDDDDDVNPCFKPSTDMWAFGVLMWELANAAEAYSTIDIIDQGDDPNFKALQDGIENSTIKLPLEETCLKYPRLAPVLLGCLQHDPEKRPNAREVLVLLGGSIEQANRHRISYLETHYSKHYQHP